MRRALQRIVRDAFFPGHSRVPDPRAGAGVAGLERWERDIGAGTVEAWFIPTPAPGPSPALVFLHGNAELIEDWTDALAPLVAAGVHVLLPEYRSYGRSGGAPSEAGITEDCVELVGRLRGRPEVDPERIVYVGRSLGGAVACCLAARVPPRALVLLSTFTSASAMAQRYFVPSFLLEDRFESLDVVRRLRVPIWIVHGSRDDLVPASHARMLAAAAQGAKLTLYDAGHNDCPPDWAVFYRDLFEFLVAAGVLEADPRRGRSRS